MSEPIHSASIDIPTDHIGLIVAAANATGLAVNFSIGPSRKGDNWRRVEAAPLAQLLKDGQRTKFFVDQAGAETIQSVEELLGPYMDAPAEPA